jgi:hypothetical protein
VASRRQLFLCLMNGHGPPRGFEWYTLEARAALPPKSLFVQLMSGLVVYALPLLLFGYVAGISGETILSAAGMIVSAAVACLFADLLLTYRQYRQWAEDWICGDCRQVFRAQEQLFSLN